jgi:hypothetical protein
MHPKKAALLASYDELSTMYGDLMRQHVAWILRPDKHGLVQSLKGVVGIPLSTLAAATSDLAYIAASHSSDEIWENTFPSGGNATPPNEEV